MILKAQAIVRACVLFLHQSPTKKSVWLSWSSFSKKSFNFFSKIFLVDPWELRPTTPEAPVRRGTALGNMS
jgi:hypothetical protein